MKGPIAMAIDRVVLPDHEGETLQDQDDIIIWTKFNITLQAVEELMAELGEAGDATRQLRVITQEVVRRNMFSVSVKHREPTVDQLLTWHEVLKQLLQGEQEGKWDKTEGTDRQYTEVIHALKATGYKMPSQKVGMQTLEFDGELPPAKPKQEESNG